MTAHVSDFPHEIRAAQFPSSRRVASMARTTLPPPPGRRAPTRAAASRGRRPSFFGIESELR